MNIFKNMSISRKLILSFLCAIVLGTVLLKLPFSLKKGYDISYLDSFFTITSAVCVTGLTVVDIGEVFSTFGNTIILFFIQLGGLGVMTFSTMVFIFLGRKMSFETRELIKEERNSDSNGGITDFVRLLIFTVISIEIIGAIILNFEFSKTMPMKKAIYYSVFHSVSAFCNAGFSLFSDSLERYKFNPLINFTISYLIILGGMGFAVINSFIMAIRKGRYRFTLTSKVAIMMSMILTFFGMILFLLLEYNNPTTLGDMSFSKKLMVSFFQSVTLRTAGFNSVPLMNIKPTTAFMSDLLMFVGASPGSTGGGIKTTTFAIIIFYVIGILKKRNNIEIFNRRIDWELMNKALAIFVISLLYVSFVIFLMLSFENFGMEKIIYEVISAFATVGLSMGITAKLSIFSKILLIITMFVGRLGPLTIALAFSGSKKTRIKYPKEDILIG